MRIGTRNANTFLIAALGSLVLLNILGLRAFLRVDATRDRIYTLSKATKATLGTLRDPVTVRAYFTDKLPAPYSGNARYVRDLLEEFRSASKSQLSFEVIDPMGQESAKDKEAKKEVKRDIFGRTFREPTPMEKELGEQGLQPVEIREVREDQVQTKRAYMGIIISHLEKREVIPLVQDTRSLEYDLTSLIRKLTRSKEPVLGFTEGHEEPKLHEKLHHLETLLSQTYKVKTVDLSKKIDDDVDAIFVLGPSKPFKPEEMKALDQFIMQGKSAAFFLDVVHVDIKTFEPTPVEHGLTPMLASYGIALDDKLVADVQNTPLNVQERRGYMVVSLPVPYPFIPQLHRLEGDSPITKGLAGINLPFVTSLSVTPGQGWQAAVLAKSSPKSWLEPKPFNIDPRRDWRSETIIPTGPHNLIAQVSGKLPSHYASEAQASSTPTSSGAPLAAISKSDARVIAAGGSALFLDEFMGRNANAALLLNIADWMLLDSDMLQMRNRGLAEAPLQPDLSDSLRNTVKVANIVGLPLLFALFGVVRWRMREARRASISI